MEPGPCHALDDLLEETWRDCEVSDRAMSLSETLGDHPVGLGVSIIALDVAQDISETIEDLTVDSDPCILE
jgi:hypothetical protein